MKRMLVGYSGFVGSNLLQFYNFDYFYNSKNFYEASNLCVDELYFCGIPAVKWHANKYPDEDDKIIENIKSILKTIKTNRIILISTIDVYENVNANYNEDYECNYKLNHKYGENRYKFELFIKYQFENYNIIRLPALFGKGLKKNIIYDLINNNELHNIPKNSEFQWYDLNWLKIDINIIIKNNIKICNLFTEPLETIEIINLFENNIQNINDNIYNNEKKMIYNTKTKYSSLFNSSIDGYVKNKEDVLINIKKFIKFIRIKKNNLCISNICIKKTSQFQFACLLKLYGIQNVQIAPTTLINNWTEFEKIDLSLFINNGLNVYSFQSITYTLNDLNIFNESVIKLLEHIKKVIDIAVLNKVKILIFGCPRNRRILNNFSNDNDDIFISFFKELGEYCVNKNITICIEPNSKKYNCNYINTIKEAGIIVKKINKENIKMMVDIGNLIMENDDINDIYNYSELICNIDIAQENMIDFSRPHILNEKFKNILNNINYNKILNLEMLINDELNELEILNNSLINFINIYGSGS
jgi:sugar phosphate isomerase/epimerase